MRVFSKGKNKGPKFTVYLPAASKKESNIQHDNCSQNQMPSFSTLPGDAIEKLSESMPRFQKVLEQSI